MEGGPNGQGDQIVPQNQEENKGGDAGGADEPIDMDDKITLQSSDM